MAHPVDGQNLRRVMRHIPAPVAVLTYSTEQELRGVTIGSFTSLSLDPPLISFNLMEGKTANDFLHVEYFGIHVLKNDQAMLSEHFAIPDMRGEDQFGQVDYYLSPEGVPVLEDCVSLLICSVYEVLKTGDHSLILGKVVRADLIEPANPLLYYQQAYFKICETGILE